MVSSNQAGFNLREKIPLSRTLGKALQRLTGQRTNSDERTFDQRSYRDWLLMSTSPKDGASHLMYLAPVWDSAKSGSGCTDNRHLSYLVESIFMNVGGSQRMIRRAVPPMPLENQLAVSVGVAVVVRGRESRPHGEGPQFDGISMQR